MTLKEYILLGLLLAVLIISSSAEADTSKDKKKDEKAEGTNVVAGDGGQGGGGGGWGGGGGGCRYGCCGHNNWGGCKCCYTAKEAIAYMESEAKPGKAEEVHDVADDGGKGGGGGGWGGGGGGGGGGCRYGCCGHNNWGGCKCCNTAKEAIAYMKSEAKPAEEVHDVAGDGGKGGGGGGWGGGGGGGGGGCRYGCCGHNNWGGCKCCNTAKEAIAYMKSEAKPAEEVHDVAGDGGKGGGGGGWGGGGGGGGGGCRYGCCGHNNWGGCKCCNTAKEAIAYMKSEAKPAEEVHDVAGDGGKGGGGGGWGGGGGGGGGGCRYGCCGHNNWGGCKCCNTAKEAIAYMKSEAKPAEEVHDVAGDGGKGGGGGGWGGGGGGGGGGCRYGCCGHNNWGGCKCCNTAKEAIAYMKSEAKP